MKFGLYEDLSSSRSSTTIAANVSKSTEFKQQNSIYQPSPRSNAIRRSLLKAIIVLLLIALASISCKFTIWSQLPQDSSGPSWTANGYGSEGDETCGRLLFREEVYTTAPCSAVGWESIRFNGHGTFVAQFYYKENCTLPALRTTFTDCSDVSYMQFWRVEFAH